MNRYSIALPRTAFGLAAVAMTALTLAVAVVAPATLDSLGDDTRVLATNDATTAGATADSNRLRIDVVGTREQATAFTPVPGVLRARKVQG